jgi:hypothetical protein
MSSAARHTLDSPMTFEYLGEQLDLFEGWALRDLARFRRLCRDNLVSCFESFLDARSGPSKIWVGCDKLEVPRDALPSQSRGRPKENKGKQDGPTLPSWLRGLFSRQTEELMQGFTNALAKPSSIREEYLMAFQAHTDSGGLASGCSLCLEVHAREGSKYSEGLVEELEKARNVRMPPSLLSPFGVRSWDPSTGKRPFKFEPTANQLRAQKPTSSHDNIPESAGDCDYAPGLGDSTLHPLPTLRRCSRDHFPMPSALYLCLIPPYAVSRCCTLRYHVYFLSVPIRFVGI